MSLIDDVLSLIFNHMDVKIIRLINHYWNHFMFSRYCEQLKKITNQDVFNYMKNNTILLQNTNNVLYLHTSLNCLTISVYHNILNIKTKENGEYYSRDHYIVQNNIYYMKDYLTSINCETFNQMKQVNIMKKSKSKKKAPI